MKTKIKTNILNYVSKKISKLTDLEFVVLMLAITMGLFYIGWELGRATARM